MDKSLPSIPFGTISLRMSTLIEGESSYVARSTLAETSQATAAFLNLEEEEAHNEPIGLERVVEDIVFQFRGCSQCLLMGHNNQDCTRKIRFCNCYRLGHIAKSCFKQLFESLQRWVPKKIQSKGDEG
jgi:hypothetical protein